MLWRDYDWTNVTVAAGITVVSTVQVSRVGSLVQWRGEVSGNFTTSGITIATGLPTWARPRFTYRDSGAALGSSGAVAAVGTVGTDGGVVVRALSTASGAVYLKGLSGYEGA